MTTPTPRQEPAIPFRTMSAEEAALRRDLAAHREALREVETALERQESFLRTFKCGCTIANEAGHIDPCGPCMALDDLDQALARIQSILKTTQAER